MRTSDPAAYDQHFQISNTNTATLAYRGILLTASANTTVTLTIGNTVNGTIATKTMALYLAANSTFLLPLSGESFSTSTVTNVNVFLLL